MRDLRPKVELVVRSFQSGRVIGLVTTDAVGRWRWWTSQPRRPRLLRWLPDTVWHHGQVPVFKKAGRGCSLRQALVGLLS
jgi:hypothetical protein